MQGVGVEVATIPLFSCVAYENSLVEGDQLAYWFAHAQLDGHQKDGQVIENQSLNNGVSGVNVGQRFFKAFLEAMKVKDDYFLLSWQHEGKYLLKNVCQGDGHTNHAMGYPNAITIISAFIVECQAQVKEPILQINGTVSTYFVFLVAN